MAPHRAKGLEFSHASLVGWESGLFPPNYGDLNEERRLAYVGITHGMQRATIFYCNFRHGASTPADFIRDIPEPNRVLGWNTQPTVPSRTFRVASTA
jgi:DNA helicase II / ATP-dependent DNA helicase PcrA